MRREYWKAKGVEGVQPPSPDAEPPSPDHHDHEGPMTRGRRGPLPQLRALVMREIDAIVADGEMDPLRKIIRLSAYDLMLSDRPATRGLGLKVLMAHSGVSKARVDGEHRRDRMDRVRSRVLYTNGRPEGSSPMPPNPL